MSLPSPITLTPNVGVWKDKQVVVQGRAEGAYCGDRP